MTFFTVPTLRFRVLYVFLVLAHDRRRILHHNVTAHPTAEWTGQQLREAFPFDHLPRYMLRDQDAIFGIDFQNQVRGVGIREVLSAPRSPWQRAYIERVIGSIRRECLDHVIVFHEALLRRTLASYLDYDHRSWLRALRQAKQVRHTALQILVRSQHTIQYVCQPFTSQRQSDSATVSECSAFSNSVTSATRYMERWRNGRSTCVEITPTGCSCATLFRNLKSFAC